MSSGIACYVAALSVQFSRAPGWRDQRYFSLAAFAAAAFAALNVPTVAPVLSDGAVVLTTRIQLALVALHVVRLGALLERPRRQAGIPARPVPRLGPRDDRSGRRATGRVLHRGGPAGRDRAPRLLVPHRDHHAARRRGVRRRALARPGADRAVRPGVAPGDRERRGAVPHARVPDRARRERPPRHGRRVPEPVPLRCRLPPADRGGRVRAHHPLRRGLTRSRGPAARSRAPGGGADRGARPGAGGAAPCREAGGARAVRRGRRPRGQQPRVRRQREPRVHRADGGRRAHVRGPRRAQGVAPVDAADRRDRAAAPRRGAARGVAARAEGHPAAAPRGRRRSPRSAPASASACGRRTSSRRASTRSATRACSPRSW